MTFFGDVVAWFGDNWSGTDGILNRLAEHVQLSLVSLAVAILVALPIGVWLGHVRKGGLLAINVSNIGRALPSFALLILMVQIVGVGDLDGPFRLVGSVPTFVVLVALAIPPILTNTYVALTEVDADVREAARGMGMSGTQSLKRVELPMALPLIMAGIRTAAVAVVATAALAAYIGWGGLGRFIIDGIASQDDVEVFAGALLVAGLSIAFELTLAGLQVALVSRGLRSGGESIGREIEEAMAELDPASEVSAPRVPTTSERDVT